MAEPIGMILKGYVNPILAANGFTKTGATYRLVAENGDQVMINFQRTSSSTFYVNLAALPRPAWEFIRIRYPRLMLRQPSEEYGPWRHRLRTDADEAGYWYNWQPGSLPRPPGSSDEWLVRGVEGVAVCGAVLAAALRDEALPLLLPLLDRQVFLSHVRDQRSPFLRQSLATSELELFLLIDEGPSDRLEAQIAALEEEAQHPDQPWSLVAWARQRLATRTQDECRSAAAEREPWAGGDR